ncbi:hypothetical protein GGS26DRAFT_212973 [Hypomontagnella submonticulosa]|nr:hypothetical protein GGS26DRAFT_212973 [Hypomontagnella submonticulosa]
MGGLKVRAYLVLSLITLFRESLSRFLVLTDVPAIHHPIPKPHDTICFSTYPLFSSSSPQNFPLPFATSFEAAQVKGNYQERFPSRVHRIRPHHEYLKTLPTTAYHCTNRKYPDYFTLLALLCISHLVQTILELEQVSNNVERTG